MSKNRDGTTTKPTKADTASAAHDLGGKADQKFLTDVVAAKAAVAAPPDQVSAHHIPSTAAKNLTLVSWERRSGDVGTTSSWLVCNRMARRTQRRSAMSRR